MFGFFYFSERVDLGFLWIYHCILEIYFICFAVVAKNLNMEIVKVKLDEENFL